jgi:hypothetical protein
MHRRRPVAAVLLGLMALLASCSWNGLRRGIYGGATANQRDRQETAGRPPEEPAPTFDQYEKYRTGKDP